MVITVATMRITDAKALQCGFGGGVMYGKLGVVGPRMLFGSYGLNVLASFAEVVTCGARRVVPATRSAFVTALAAASTYHKFVLVLAAVCCIYLIFKGILGYPRHE